MKKRALFLFVILAHAVLPVAAQKGRNAEVRRIAAYVKTLDAFVKRNKRPHLIFADTSVYDRGSEPQWRKFASEKALEKFREQTETYTIAYNWRRQGRIVKSNFTLFSPSGDWAQYVYHTFRADGTLAFAQAEMRTFNGELVIVQDFYFDRRGALLKKTIKYRDLQTDKPIKPTKEFLENNADFSDNVEYYKKTSKLPFASLLKTTKK
jgi:hypothetical protein